MCTKLNDPERPQQTQTFFLLQILSCTNLVLPPKTHCQQTKHVSSTTNNPRKCTVPTNNNGKPVNARPQKKSKNTKLTAKPLKKKPEPTSRTPNTKSKLPKVPPMQRPSVKVEEISSDDDDNAQPLPPMDEDEVLDVDVTVDDESDEDKNDEPEESDDTELSNYSFNFI